MKRFNVHDEKTMRNKMVEVYERKKEFFEMEYSMFIVSRFSWRHSYRSVSRYSLLLLWLSLPIDSGV